jgi:hypothetical protein
MSDEEERVSARSVRVLDARALPANVVREVSAALASSGRAGPIVRARVSFAHAERIALVAALVCVPALAAIGVIGFARPCTPHMGLSWLAAFGLIAAPIAFALVRWLAWRTEAQRAALPQGLFVLARDVVLVRGHSVSVLPTAAIAGVGGPTRLPVGGESDVSLWVEGTPALHGRVPSASAEGQVAAIEAAAEAAKQPIEGRDPLAELKAQRAWDTAGGRAPARLGRDALLAVPVALLLGLVVLETRDSLSDALALSAASGDLVALRCYADAGGAHADEVRRVTLPNTAYAQAASDGSADALSAFLTSYPGSPHESDARTAMYARAYADAQASSWSMRAFLERYPDAPQAAEVRAALPAASLREAIASDDVDAYAYVVATYPGTPEAAEAARRRHERFASYAARAGQGSDAGATAFFAALLAYVEAHQDVHAFVRFRTPTAGMLTEFDELVRTRNDTMMVEPIAPSFTHRLNFQRENVVYDRLRTAFERIAPHDVLPLALGRSLPPVLDEVQLAADLMALPEEERAAEEARRREAADDDSGEPEIRVGYVVTPTGEVYVSRPDPTFGGALPEGLDPELARRFGMQVPEDDTRQLAGFSVHFDIEMRVPGESARRALALDVQPPPSFTVDTGESDVATGTLYDTMATRAFDQLADRLVAAFFAPAGDATPPADDAVP